MGNRKRYRKKSNQYIIAVQLRLEASGFTYCKWGAEQYCKSGDWLVDNGGDVYTVDKEVFANTYEQIEPGRYRKSSPVWAEIAAEAGVVKTKEGQSHFLPGDYLVSNNEDGSDAYCISSDKFESMYELDKKDPGEM